MAGPYNDPSRVPSGLGMPPGWSVEPPKYSSHEPSTGGRFRRGWRIAWKSCDVIADNKSLILLPLLSFVLLAVAALLILGPTLLASERDGTSMPFIYGLVIAAYPFNLISTFFGVAFVHVVRAQLNGAPTSVRDGLRFAWSRIGAIAGWALVATAVGLAIQALSRVRGGAVAARIAGWLLGAAWAIAVFFVIPVLASEDVGPIKAARESASVVKRKWAEGVVGSTVIGAFFSFLMLPVVIVGVIGWASLASSPAFGAIALAIAAVLFILLFAAQAAVDGVFRFALYDYAVSGAVHAPFTEADLASGMTPKKRWFRRG